MVAKQQIRDVRLVAGGVAGHVLSNCEGLTVFGLQLA